MRIHHIINSFDSKNGGAEIVVGQLHQKLRALGTESYILGLESQTEQLIHASSLGLDNAYCAKALKGIQSYIKQNCINGDIVHAHLFPSNLYCSLIRKFTSWDGPLVCTEHSTSNRRRISILGRIIDHLIYPSYDRIVCVSQGVKKELDQWMPRCKQKTQVILNGVKLNYIKYKPRNDNNEPVIVSVGRLCEAKNYANTLQAIALLPNIHFKYYVAGAGEKEESLKELCSKLKLDHKVTFLGHVTNVYCLLEKADIFLIPSRWEGFGLAAVEGMNAGLPIIAGDVIGLRDLINYQKPCGILVDPNNRAKIAEAIKTLVQQPQIRLKYGRNAFETSKEYDFDEMVYAYTEFYKEVQSSVINQVT